MNSICLFQRVDLIALRRMVRDPGPDLRSEVRCPIFMKLLCESDLKLGCKVLRAHYIARMLNKLINAISRFSYNYSICKLKSTIVKIRLYLNLYSYQLAPEGYLNMNCIFILLILACAHHVTAAMYKLVLHSQERGAACLDGSPPGFYIHEGSGINRTKYLLYFNGGGFCGGSSLSQTLQSCYSRSKTDLGTTKVFKQQMSYDNNGVLSTKSELNPTFYDWTKIFIIYCDGACHQGYRQQPIQYKDRNLYFRGSRNVMEHFRYLDQHYDFYNGQSIVIAGVSAGGMAVYQWSNYLFENTKKAKVYSIPDSGFFITDYYSPLAEAKVLGQKIYNLFKLVSSESALQLPQPIRQCLQEPEHTGDFVACFDSANYVKYLKAPMLIVQSPYDQWCLNYILVVRCLSNSKPPYSLSKCNDTVMAAIAQYRRSSIQGLKYMRSYRKDIGGWGPACVQHGYIFYPSLTSQSFKIPSETGLTLNEVIDIFLNDPQQVPWLIEQQVWPGNKGCNGINGFLRTQITESKLQQI